MNQKNQLRKNPSRETCESIIRRILMTELTQNGKNRHFRKATDFMSYFESLYPASDALTKQVQRAVQSFAYAEGCRWIFYCGQDSCTSGTGTMPWEIICRCKCLPPSNGTGRDRFSCPYPPICRNFCCIHSNRVISLPGRFLPSFAPVMVC